MNSSSPLLRMEGVSKSFSATQALDSVSLEVHSGEVMALVGENGAGKSTLMKILSGAISPDSGQMYITGRPYSPKGPHDARVSGVSMIYQELSLAPDMNVEDNIMLGQEERQFGLLSRSTQRPRVRRVLDLLGHGDVRFDSPASSYSVGTQQLIEIARALITDAKIIVFDEPTSSLTQRDVEHLFDVIRKLRSRGIGIIYISHFLEEIREICDRYTVLRDGKTIGSGDLNDVRESEIVTMMVGRDVKDLFPVISHESGEVVLELESISSDPTPCDVSMKVHSGEVFGIAGLVGAGRTELIRAIFGLDSVRKGKVKVRSISIPPRPKDCIQKGLGMVSEDRKEEGLAQNCSIADNITYSRLQPYSTWGWLNLFRRETSVNHWMQELQIKAVSGDQDVESLSGGNQQKVAIARVLHQDADVLLLDEPTRGIDVGTKAEIYRLIQQLAAQGKAIIFVSSYLPELLAVCDRLGVMSKGRLREVRDVVDWTEEDVMACAIGMEV